jgi:hypothetical protein
MDTTDITNAISAPSLLLTKLRRIDLETPVHQESLKEASTTLRLMALIQIHVQIECFP